MIDSPPAMAPDAAIALGIASTAMPFARTTSDEAERWLRILRVYGEAGAALQALGVSEGSLRRPGRRPDPSVEPERSAGAEPARSALDTHGEPSPDPVELVVEEAAKIAVRRGRSGVGTAELLLGVMCVYGAEFDGVLEAHGADRDELLRRLGVSTPLDEICG